jgi:hypothetical protein
MKRKISKSGVPLRIYPCDPIPGAWPAAFEQTEDDFFVLFDGRRIAKRGKPNTPHAKMWVPLEPGIVVLDAPDLSSITIEINGVRMH